MLSANCRKKIDDAKYVGYWEKTPEQRRKTQAVNKIRRDIAKTKIRNCFGRKSLIKIRWYPQRNLYKLADVCSVLDFHTDRTGRTVLHKGKFGKLDALAVRSIEKQSQL